MKIEIVPIDSVREDPENVRAHNQRNLEAIKASLKRFGQQKPIVINRDGIVIAGNGTLRAARELGWPNINVIKTKLDGIEAIAFSVADNRTSDLSDWDNEALGKVLSKIPSKEVEDILFFNNAELANILAFEVPEDFSPEEEWTDMPEFDQEEKRSKYKIIVHINSIEDLKEFSKKINQNLTENTKFIWFPPQENFKANDYRYNEEDASGVLS